MKDHNDFRAGKQSVAVASKIQEITALLNRGHQNPDPNPNSQNADYTLSLATSDLEELFRKYAFGNGMRELFCIEDPVTLTLSPDPNAHPDSDEANLSSSIYDELEALSAATQGRPKEVSIIRTIDKIKDCLPPQEHCSLTLTGFDPACSLDFKVRSAAFQRSLGEVEALNSANVVGIDYGTKVKKIDRLIANISAGRAICSVDPPNSDPYRNPNYPTIHYSMHFMSTWSRRLVPRLIAAIKAESLNRDFNTQDGWLLSEKAIMEKCYNFIKLEGGFEDQRDYMEIQLPLLKCYLEKSAKLLADPDEMDSSETDSDDSSEMDSFDEAEIRTALM